MALHPVLASLSEEEHEAFIAECSNIHLLNKEKLVDVGQIVEDCYVLLSGVLRLEIWSNSNLGLLTTDLIPPPAFILESNLVSQFESSRCLTALGEATLVKIPMAVFLETLSTNPRVSRALAEHFMTESILLRRKIGRIYSSTPVFRVALAMHEAAERCPKGMLILSKHVKQGYLAQAIGLSREQVNKVIKGFELQNLVYKTQEGYKIDTLLPSLLDPIFPIKSPLNASRVIAAVTEGTRLPKA
jgi:CRP-like cAMP-binding protein